MKSIRMIRFDIRNFFLKNKKRFLFPVIFSVLSYFILCSIVSDFQRTDAAALGNWNQKNIKVTFLDWWYYTFAGLGKMSIGEKFEVPASWIVVNLFLLFMASGYLSFAMKGMGKLVMLKCNSERKWWLTKGVLNILTVLIYYMLLVVPVLVITGIRGCLFQRLTPYIMENLSLPYLINDSAGSVIWMILLPVMSGLALLFLMELLELYLGASLSFLLMAVFMIISAYLSVSSLNGIFIMLRRTLLFAEDGVSWIQTAGTAAVMIILSQILGCRRCGKMDIGLEGEKR